MKPMSSNHENFIIVKNVIPYEVCELLADYAKFKAKTKPNIKKKDALSGTHREYGDPIMETLLEKLTPVIEKATGLSLWPTLSFYYTYTNGHELAPHKDRSSCEIVAGLCIGADEAFKQSRRASWPLFIDNHGTPVPVALDYGDIVIFRGHETTHWREKFTGNWFVSAIFGYVEKNGPYAFQKYDQRKMLGNPHVGMLPWLYGCIKNRFRR